MAIFQNRIFAGVGVFAAVLLLAQLDMCFGVAKFTNIQCCAVNANFSEFSECRMRAVKRNVNELTVRLKVLHSPLTDVSMRWQLLKKASGYKPFLYDIHAELCEYLEKRNHPFLNIIFNAILSNQNNSAISRKCPLSTEIGLDNFRFPDKILEALPLPFGEYALFATFGTSNMEDATLKIYFMLTEF